METDVYMENRERKRENVASLSCLSLAAPFKKSIFSLSSPTIFQRILPSNRLFEMHGWMEMAVVVGRKLAVNGQERLLQRIFDGVTSNLFLDVSDFKESDDHTLLRLVWRKFPRNRLSTEGQKMTISHSTQTNESSRQGLHKIPKIPSHLTRIASRPQI